MIWASEVDLESHKRLKSWGWISMLVIHLEMSGDMFSPEEIWAIRCSILNVALEVMSGAIMVDGCEGFGGPYGIFLWPIRWNGVTRIWSSWVPHLASLLPSSLPNIFVCVRTFWNMSWCVVFRIIMLPMSYASWWLCWEDMWRIWLLRRYMQFDFFEILKLFWAIVQCAQLIRGVCAGVPHKGCLAIMIAQLQCVLQWDYWRH